MSTLKEPDSNELDQVVKTIAERITTRIGKKAPYIISVSRNLREDADIVIRSGNPVEIYVSHLFLIDSLTNNKKKAILDRIERALDKSKDCHKTLSNYQIINYRESVALLKEAKRWLRSSNPNAYIEKVSTIFFKKKYTVTITDILTQLEVSMTGTNLKKIEEEAIRHLIHLVEADEEQEEVRQIILDARKIVPTRDKIPEEVTISGSRKKDENGVYITPNNPELKMDYKYENEKDKLNNDTFL